MFTQATLQRALPLSLILKTLQFAQLSPRQSRFDGPMVGEVTEWRRKDTELSSGQRPVGSVSLADRH